MINDLTRKPIKENTSIEWYKRIL